MVQPSNLYWNPYGLNTIGDSYKESVFLSYGNLLELFNQVGKQNVC